jgi:hypothetical protein
MGRLFCFILCDLPQIIGKNIIISFMNSEFVLILKVIIVRIGQQGWGSALVIDYHTKKNIPSGEVPRIGSRIDFTFSPAGIINNNDGEELKSSEEEDFVIPSVGETWFAQQGKPAFKLKGRTIESNIIIVVNRNGQIDKKPPTGHLSEWHAVQFDMASMQPWQVPVCIPYLPTPAGMYTCSMVPGETNMVCMLSLTQREPGLSICPPGISNPVRQIDLVGVLLNWQEGEITSNGALPEIISSTAIELFKPIEPEFPLRASCIVAYPMDKVQEKERIYCCFRTSNMTLQSQVMSVRAVVQHKPDSIITLSTFSFTTTELNPHYLYSSYSMLNVAGLYRGFIPFEINTPVITAEQKAVGEYKTDWLWQSTRDNPESTDAIWHVIEVMPVTTYLTLSEPQYPWEKSHFVLGAEPSAQVAPYQKLLRLACCWAAGAQSEFEVAKNITTYLLNHPLFIYYISASAFTIYKTQNNIPLNPCKGEDACRIFNATKLGEVLWGMEGNSVAVDCVDLSHIVMLLANSIGCNMRVVTLANTQDPSSGFTVNTIIPLGSNTPNSHYSFTFHQVAYTGDFSKGTALIFDPCFRFYKDGHARPTLGIPSEKYLQLLAATPGTVQFESDACPEIIQFI